MRPRRRTRRPRSRLFLSILLIFIFYLPWLCICEKFVKSHEYPLRTHTCFSPAILLTVKIWTSQIRVDRNNMSLATGGDRRPQKRKSNLRAWDDEQPGVFSLYTPRSSRERRKESSCKWKIKERRTAWSTKDIETQTKHQINAGLINNRAAPAQRFTQDTP